MTDTLRTRIARVICDASWKHGRGLTIGQAESVALDVERVIVEACAERSPLIADLVKSEDE